MKIIYAAFIFAFVVTAGAAFAIDGSPTGWWTDSNGVNHYGNPPSQSSRSSNTSYSSPSSHNSNYAAPDYGMQMMSSVMTSIQQQMQQQQMQQQQNMQTAVNINNQAVVYHNQGDYDTAIAYYEQALSFDPYNSGIVANLNKAKAKRARNKGEEVMNSDGEAAVQYFRESLSYEESAEVREYLKIAEEGVKIRKETIAREGRLKDAKTRVDQALGDIANQLDGTAAVSTTGTSGGLDFMGKQYAFKDSDPSAVDLSFMPADKPQVIDPKTVRGADADKEKGAHYNNVPKDKIMPPGWDEYANSTKAEIVLDALEKGNHDWNGSVGYLENYLRKNNPHDVKVREALSYIEGLRAGAAAKIKAVPAKIDPFAAGTNDTDALMEVIANKKMDKVPKPVDIFEWKNTRTDLVLEAIEKGNKNWDKSLAYLDNRIKHNPLDYDAMRAKAYLEGFVAYDEFLKKNK